MPSAVEKSKVTSAACNTEKAKKAIKKIEKKRFILHINNLWYKITTNPRNERNNTPKKVINNGTFFGVLHYVVFTSSLFGEQDTQDAKEIGACTIYGDFKIINHEQRFTVIDN